MKDKDKNMTEAERGAAVAIVRARQPRESILLMRRSERKEDSWSGHWSFPGGRRDPDDPDLLHTALRELEEECGIRLGREQMEAALPPVWLPQSAWCDPTRHFLKPVPNRPGNLLFPAFDLNGTPVWGFTYRLVMDWLGLLPEQSQLEQAGFAVACSMLDFLLSHGLKLKSTWEDRMAQSWTNERIAVKAAEVEGAIPVALVAARFASAKENFPHVNLLELRPDCIRVVGLEFEEYLISTTT
jgi:8-oxo-dGTP pyrophosphatase MutT (NUDIX family)